MTRAIATSGSSRRFSASHSDRENPLDGRVIPTAEAIPVLSPGEEKSAAEIAHVLFDGFLLRQRDAFGWHIAENDEVVFLGFAHRCRERVERVYVELLCAQRRGQIRSPRRIAIDVENHGHSDHGGDGGSAVVLAEVIVGRLAHLERIRDLTRNRGATLEQDVVVARLQIHDLDSVESVDDVPLLQREFHPLRHARKHVGVKVECLLLAHLVRDAQLAHRHLARHRALGRDDEHLDPEARRAVRLRQQVSIRLDSVREDHSVTQIALGIEPVRELQRARDVRSGSEPGAVSRDEGCPLGGATLVDRNDPRPLRERDEAKKVILGTRFDRLLQLRAGVVQPGVRDAVAHVDEIHRAQLLRRRRPRQTREPERDHGDERETQKHREHALRERKVGQALAHHPYDVGGEKHDPEHAWSEQLVADSSVHPCDCGGSEPNESEVYPERERERHGAEGAPTNLGGREVSHTVTRR